jgi:hypothetical protein
MNARLIQFLADDGSRAAGLLVDDTVVSLVGVATVYELAQRALGSGRSLGALAGDHARGARLPYERLFAERRVLPPLDHPDPAHLMVSGTGLTHLGSASGRDAMHKAAEGNETDSMKMFRWGVERGKPPGGESGVQPEWFYKGDGSIIVAPGADLPSPDFALDGGEEPELVGCYLVDGDGAPRRLGFAIGNEFSDHVTEKQNYLYLAHSKLRSCSFGPALCLGDLPASLSGTSSVLDVDGKVRWSAPFLTGEANMSHWIAGLEYHHFKYAQFRRPGDVHLHFFGTSTLSFSAGIRVEEGETFRIEMPDLGPPLVNRLVRTTETVPAIRPL